MNTNTKPTSNKIIGMRRESEMLRVMANYGWITARMGGLAVYTDNSETVAVNKSRTVLQRLKEKKEVLTRKTGVGTTAYVLTERGANRVNEELLQEGFSRGWAHHGLDLSTLHYEKQEVIVDYLNERKKRGMAVIGKAGMRAGLIPEEFHVFDAVSVYLDSDYTEGLLVLGNCAEGTLDRILQAKKLCNVHLIADPLVIKGLEKKRKAREEQAY